jgi:hypothetical protein
MSEIEHDKPHQTVRFTSENETIAPESSLELETLVSPPKRETRDDLTEEAQEELKNLSITLQKSRLQTKRMEHFAYDPVSLPPSRVSHSDKRWPLFSYLTKVQWYRYLQDLAKVSLTLDLLPRNLPLQSLLLRHRL